MILQAQALTRGGVVVFYENRECCTETEAATFREDIERQAGDPSAVRVVSLCGRLSVRVEMPEHHPFEV